MIAIITENTAMVPCVVEASARTNWLVVYGQAAIIAGALVAGVLYALVYRRRTRNRKFMDEEAEAVE